MGSAWPRGEPGRLLPRSFFGRSPVDVAPALLGCVLEHRSPEGLVAVRLTEVEAYTGGTDPASHSYRGRTRRNAVMFGPPGHAYVYFTYGMHFCVNLVCLPAGTPEAVLLRAGQVVAGVALARPGGPPPAPTTTSRGPGPAVPGAGHRPCPRRHRRVRRGLAAAYPVRRGGPPGPGEPPPAGAIRPGPGSA